MPGGPPPPLAPASHASLSQAAATEGPPAQAERVSCWAPQPAGHTSLKRQPTLLSKIFRCPDRRVVGIFTGTEVDGHVERLPASYLLSGRKASGVQGVKNDSLKQECH